MSLHSLSENQVGAKNRPAKRPSLVFVPSAEQEDDEESSAFVPSAEQTSKNKKGRKAT
jgi:hypothetical protein